MSTPQDREAMLERLANATASKIVDPPYPDIADAILAALRELEAQCQKEREELEAQCAAIRPLFREDRAVHVENGCDLNPCSWCQEVQKFLDGTAGRDLLAQLAAVTKERDELLDRLEKLEQTVHDLMTMRDTLKARGDKLAEALRSIHVAPLSDLGKQRIEALAEWQKGTQ